MRESRTIRIDGKRRITPCKYANEKSYIVYATGFYIRFFTSSDVEYHKNILLKGEELGPRRRNLERMFSESFIVDVEEDGRVVIPQELLDKVGISITQELILIPDNFGFLLWRI